MICELKLVDTALACMPYGIACAGENITLPVMHHNNGTWQLLHEYHKLLKNCVSLIQLLVCRIVWRKAPAILV
jgi:hypothetical protein